MTRALPSIRATVALAAAALAVVLLGSCSERFPDEAPRLSIAEIEQIYQQTRDLGDQIEVTYYRALPPTGAQYADLIASYFAASKQLERALSVEPSPPISEEDGRALIAMRQAVEDSLPGVRDPTPETAHVGVPDDLDCQYDAETLAMGDGGYEALSERIYECYAAAAHSISFEGEQLNDLTVFSRLTLISEPSRREALWRSLAPMWESYGGDGVSQSPYQLFLRMHTARMKERGEVPGELVRGIGVEPEVMEQWLIRVLEKWREIAPDTTVEPWDFVYLTGGAHRALLDAMPVESLQAINDRFYRDLGADPSALRVQYDLEPRPEKEPYSLATYDRRPRFENGRWVPGKTWVVSSHQMGGLDNLLELLHETGHAIHISAIRTRPAFTDWPDSDIFSEAVADIAMLEMYEPAWQQRYLGSSVSMQDAFTAKYAYIAGFIAEALFELRMHREPERNPNEVWSEICERYFRIRPHPELAWWGVWPQLIMVPGYMMNYAAGAILSADLRARAQKLYGPYAEGDPAWYGRISEHLYRFGRERPTKEVIEDFLGRPVSPQAILDDMERALAVAN